MEQLMTIGGFVPLPFVLYAIIQTLRKHPQVNRFGVLLAYFAVLIPVGLFAWGTVQQTLPPLLTFIVAVSAAIALLFGLVLVVSELRHQPRAVSRSYGLLCIGVSVLIALGLVATPTILTLIPNATSTVSAAASTGDFAAAGAPPAFGAENVGAVATNTGNTSAQATPNGFPAAPAGFSAPVGFALPAESTEEATPTLMLTNTPAASAATHSSARQAVLPTITPSPAISATPTPFASLATAVPTVSAITCDLLTLYNLNLRAEADADSELLLTIPYGTSITAVEVNADGWWRVSFGGQEGWVSGEYVSPAATCSTLSGE